MLALSVVAKHRNTQCWKNMGGFPAVLHRCGDTETESTVYLHANKKNNKAQMIKIFLLEEIPVVVVVVDVV